MGGPDQESKKPLGTAPDDYDEDSATEIGPSLKPVVRPMPSRPAPSAGMRSTKPPPLPARASVRPMRVSSGPNLRPSDNPIATPRQAPPRRQTLLESEDGPPTIAGVRGSKTNLPVARYEAGDDESTTARREAIGDSDEDQTTRVSAAQIHALLAEQPPPSARPSARDVTGPMPVQRATPPQPPSNVTLPLAQVPPPSPRAYPQSPAHLQRPPPPAPMDAPQLVPLSRADIFPLVPTPIWPQANQGPQGQHRAPSNPHMPPHGKAGPSLPPQYPASPQGGSVISPGRYLQSVPGIPVIPPLLPNGEAIALEPARFDAPSLAVLRGDVKLPYIGQPPSSKSLVDASDMQSQKKWVIVAIVAVFFALSVAAVVAILAARK